MDLLIHFSTMLKTHEKNINLTIVEFYRLKSMISMFDSF